MSPNDRLMTALKRGTPDRVPFSPFMIRWIRHRYGCTCPHHQIKVAQELDLDPIVTYGHYVWQSLSNDYLYTPGGGYSYAASGLYGDLPDVRVEIRVENRQEHAWYYRTFHTPSGDLHDVIQWARPSMGYGDGPNPHRVEPLVKVKEDLQALRHLYPPLRRDLIADIPIVLEQVGNKGILAVADTTHAGAWGLEPLGAEGMLIASVTDPELLKGMCRMAQDIHLRNLKAALEQGIKVVFDSWFQFGPAVGWSPKTYEEVFLPLVREAINLAHNYDAIYIYQDDGKMKDILPLLVKAGVDVFSGLQPPDVGNVVLKDVKAKYGKQVALLGGMDPCYAFDLGTPDTAFQAASKAIADAGPDGYILGTAEAVAPETPVESLRAAVKACLKASGQSG